MSRAHYVENVLGVSGSGALSLMAGATVHVYDAGTMTPIAQTIYDSDGGSGTLSNPLTSDANGKVEFWLDTPARVDLAVSKTGFTAQTRTVDVEDAPSGGGGSTWITVPVSSAELLDLHNMPKELVAAPGAGKWVFPLHVFYHFIPHGTPYGGSGNLAVQDANADNIWFGYQNFPVGYTNEDMAYLTPWNSANQDAGAADANTALVLALRGGGAALTDGNGTLEVTIEYQVVPTA